MAARWGPRESLALFAPVVLIGFAALQDGAWELVTRQQVWLMVWWALAIAYAFSLLPRALPPSGWKLAVAGFAGLGSLQLAAAFWGPSADSALADACRSFGYLGIAALAWSSLGPRSWMPAATGLFAVAAGVTLIALAGRLAPGLPGLDDEFGAGRLAEPLGYWNALGAWGAITLAMALAWGSGARRRRSRGIAAAVAPAAILVVYLTYSRGAVLAAAVGVVAVVLLSRDTRRAALLALGALAAGAAAILTVRAFPEVANDTGDSGALAVAAAVVLGGAGCWWMARRLAVRRRAKARVSLTPRAAAAAIIGLAAAVMAVALVAGSDGFGRGGDAAAFDDPAQRLTTASGNRSAYWSEALSAFAAKPLVGEGSGSFAYRWASEGSDPELVSDPHSIVLAFASELGILGLAALALLLAGLVRGALRGLSAAEGKPEAVALAAGFAIFLASAAIDWTWESTAFATLGLGCAFVLAMAASRPLGASARSAAKAVPAPFRWGTVALAIALGAVQVPGIVSTEFVREAIDERRLGDPADAILNADEAIAAAPWSAAAYAARAEAWLAADDVEAARRDARAALDREEREAAHWVLLAEIEAAGDRLPEAARALRRAVALSPHEPLLGSREVYAIGLRLARAGYVEADILGSGG